MFFKKELFITRDMQYYAKATEILNANGIKYYLKYDSPFQSSRYHGIPSIKTEAMYEYKVYVKSKDFEFAKSLI